MGTPPPQNWPILVLIHLMGWLGWGYQFSPPLQTLAYNASSPCNVDTEAFLFWEEQVHDWLIDWYRGEHLEKCDSKAFVSGGWWHLLRLQSLPCNVSTWELFWNITENSKEMILEGNRATHSFVAIISASCKSKVLPNIPHGRQPLSFLIVFHDQDVFGRKIFFGPV